MLKIAIAALLVLALTGCREAEVQTDVRPGSFCSPAGAQGRTADGATVRCTREAGEERARWQR